jgi:hypothetical protein
MWILERGALRSKSKCLAQQAFLTPHPSKIKDFCHLLPREKALKGLPIIKLCFDDLGVL